MKKIEFAKLLQCSPGAITALVKRGMPKAPDGSLNSGECLRWIARSTSGKNGGWGAGRRGLCLQERAQALLSNGAKPEPAAAFVGSDAHQVVLDALRRIASPEAILRFAAVALRAGCTPTQAYVTAVWYACQPSLELTEIDADDLTDFSEPTREQWLELFGPDFDLDAAEAAHDAATISELQPSTAV